MPNWTRRSSWNKQSIFTNKKRWSQTSPKHLCLHPLLLMLYSKRIHLYRIPYLILVFWEISSDKRKHWLWNNNQKIGQQRQMNNNDQKLFKKMRPWTQMKNKWHKKVHKINWFQKNKSLRDSNQILLDLRQWVIQRGKKKGKFPKMW